MVVEQVQRNPYTVGGVVRGPKFYGRAALIDAIIGSSDCAIWLVGNRRSGKTSMLYRLEEISASMGQVALRTSMDACNTVAEFVEWWADDLDDESDRLARLGLTTADLQGKALHEILRLLDRRGREHDVDVLLLLDEAEALIGIAKTEGDDVLKDMRRVLERCERLRVVFSATKGLAALDDICCNWETTTFLDSVALRYLEPLTHDEALTLIRQSQSESPLIVDDATAEAIYTATSGHPYLVSWLCSRLWSEKGLRAPVEDDLTLDTALTDLFQKDYDYLAPIERRILHVLADVKSGDAATVLARLDTPIADVQLRSLMATMKQLCYVSCADNQYCIANQLLHNWLQFCEVNESAPLMTDQAAVAQADEEQQRVSSLIMAHRQRLAYREKQQAELGINAPPEVAIEAEQIRAETAKLEQELVQLRMRR